MSNLRTLLAILVLTWACGCSAKTPARVRSKDGLSRGRDGAYRVLLPPGYPEGGPYPVVLFLHDYFGDSGTLWRHRVAEELTRRMTSGEIPRFVLVAPDGGHSWWSDSADGRRRYESWMVRQLLPEIEARYRVRRDRDGRAVAGISMGGHGAIKLALRHPELFAAAGSLSGALVRLDWDFVISSPWPSRLSLEHAFGRDPIENRLRDNEIYELLHDFATRPGGARAKPRFWLRCGEGDKYHLDHAATVFAAAARAAGFEVVFASEPGKHDWTYWRASGPAWLATLVASLPRQDGRMHTYE